MSQFKRFGEAGKYMQLLIKSVFVMLFCILSFFGIGLYLVHRFALPTEWIIAFIFFGIGLSFYYMYHQLKKLDS